MQHFFDILSAFGIFLLVCQKIYCFNLYFFRLLENLKTGGGSGREIQYTQFAIKCRRGAKNGAALIIIPPPPPPALKKGYIPSRQFHLKKLCRRLFANDVLHYLRSLSKIYLLKSMCIYTDILWLHLQFHQISFSSTHSNPAPPSPQTGHELRCIYFAIPRCLFKFIIFGGVIIVHFNMNFN